VSLNRAASALGLPFRDDMQNRRRDEGRRRKFDEALNDLIERLKRPCEGTPRADLEALARRMTRLRFCWDARPPVPGPY
jgi:hypothetical protein